MSFQVRDLMSNVVLRAAAANDADEDQCPSTRTPQCEPDCRPTKCPGQSGCPHPSQAPPKVSREMLSALRDQMRQALLPA